MDAALTEVEDNKPDDILTGFSQYVGRDSSGVYDGSYSSFLTIGCADGVIGDADEMIAIADGLKSQAPIFGQSGILLGLPCATWPKAKDAKPFNVSGKDLLLLSLLEQRAILQLRLLGRAEPLKNSTTVSMSSIVEKAIHHLVKATHVLIHWSKLIFLQLKNRIKKFVAIN